MLKMIPGLASKIKDSEIDEEKMMKDPEEQRGHHPLHDPAWSGATRTCSTPRRKRRVAAGCGATVQDVNLLLKQFEQARQMMKQFG